MKKQILSALLFLLGFQATAQTQVEINSLIVKTTADVSNSKALVESNYAKKIIGYGTNAIPLLTGLYTDTSQTKIYSNCHNRFLNTGEVAIILTDRIEGMPYAHVTGIQNCTMDFCEDNPNLIEYYLPAIKRDGAEKFKERYISWFESKERNNK